MMRPDPFAPGLLDELSEPPRSVVLLRASRLGDFVSATPAFRALRTALPEAEITIVTLPILRDLAQRLPTLNRYVAFPGFPGLAEQFFDARRTLRFFEEMQEKRFDLAIQMQGSGIHSNPFMLMFGATITAGFVRDDEWASCLDAALPIPRTGHEVERVLELTTFLGAPAQGTETEFPLRNADHAEALAVLEDYPRPWIGLHPGAWEPRRHWPPERFGAAGAALRGRYGGTVIVMAGPQERFLGELVVRSAGDPCLNMAGRTSLAALGALIANLDVLVANNSGPAHVAYALGTPTVVVFGGSQLARYRPLHDGPFRLALPDGSICDPSDAARRTPISNGPITDISIEQVITAAAEVMLTKEAERKREGAWHRYR